MITGENYIGFTRSAKGNRVYKTFNPQLNQENPYQFIEASQEEVDKAVTLASEAFKAYKSISRDIKAAFLNAIANEILALGDELVKVYCAESGLPEARAIGERNRTVGQLKSFAELVKEGAWVEATIDTAQPDRKPIAKPDLRKMLTPLGPVVVFGASNFPLAYSTAGGDTASALAAGCPVIVKSHPMHAGTGELVAGAVIKAAKQTGMPDGVFSNLNSSGFEVGKQLVQHPKVKAVGFTGSIAGGRALFNMAANRPEPIPVFAEMGSINPVVLLPNALKNSAENWAEIYAKSITLGTGQFCTNPGLILGLKSDSLNNFISTLAQEITKIEPSCMLHPNIVGAYENNKAKVKSQQATTVVAEYAKQTKENYAKQAVLTVEGATFLNNKTLHQEVFGPFSIVVQCEDLNQLEAILHNLEGQLTGTIIGNEEEIATHHTIVQALQNRVGRIIFNGVPTGVEVCPAMHHGGPYPASTDSRFTAVGIHAIKRWARPICYQNWPENSLPEELKNKNSLGISRLVNGVLTKDNI